MKRLGVFCFYDKDGIVDSYVEYLLDELMTVLDKLIIVVNGELQEAGCQIFRRYTDKVVRRENKGFDAGAYAEVIVNLLGDGIREWDEMVLCNDTFFGPFVPMKDIFREMECKNVDFWGLNFVDRKLLSHMQSYFLVFGPRPIQDGAVTRFFQANIDPLEDDVTDVYGKFEIGLFRYLSERQYSFAAYCDTDLCCVYESPDVCIARYGLPILKKNAFSPKHAFSKQCYDTAAVVNAIRHVQEKTPYDITCILQCVQRLYGFCWDQVVGYGANSYIDPVRVAAFRYSETELETCIGDRTFYIYGTGMIARNVFHACLHKKLGLRGFVVSDDREIGNPVVCGLPVFHYGEIPKDALVVLGVNRKLTETIKKDLNQATEYIELWEKQL